MNAMKIFVLSDPRLLSATARRLRQTKGGGHQIAVCSADKSQAEAAFKSAGLGISQFFPFPSSCRGGFGCWFGDRGKCVINDGYEAAVSFVEEAQQIIFALPSTRPDGAETYFPGGFPAPMKAAIERLVPMLKGGFQSAEEEITHPRRHPCLGPQQFSLYTTGQASGSLVEQHARRISARYFGWQYSETVEFNSSDLSKPANSLGEVGRLRSRDSVADRTNVFLAIGSPRGTFSHTAKMARQLLAAYETQLEKTLSIATFNPGDPIDLKKLSNQLNDAGIVIWAAPLYIGGFYSGMQRMIDVLPILPGAFGKKDFVLVTSSGLPNLDEAAFQEKYARQLGQNFGWNFTGTFSLIGAEVQKLIPHGGNNGTAAMTMVGTALAKGQYSTLSEISRAMKQMDMVPPSLYYPFLGSLYFSSVGQRILKTLGLAATCGKLR
ncbi:MAG: hypothetical protein WC890_04740 [Candidatus Margulisiibacteriota bacterium]